MTFIRPPELGRTAADRIRDAIANAAAERRFATLANLTSESAWTVDPALAPTTAALSTTSWKFGRVKNLFSKLNVAQYMIGLIGAAGADIDVEIAVHEVGYDAEKLVLSRLADSIAKAVVAWPGGGIVTGVFINPRKPFELDPSRRYAVSAGFAYTAGGPTNILSGNSIGYALQADKTAYLPTMNDRVTWDGINSNNILAGPTNVPAVTLQPVRFLASNNLSRVWY